MQSVLKVFILASLILTIPGTALAAEEPGMAVKVSQFIMAYNVAVAALGASGLPA